MNVNILNYAAKQTTEVQLDTAPKTTIDYTYRHQTVHNFKCLWNVGRKVTYKDKTVMVKDWRRDQFHRKLEECHSLWHKHSTSRAQRTSSTSDPVIQISKPSSTSEPVTIA